MSIENAVVGADSLSCVLCNSDRLSWTHLVSLWDDPMTHFSGFHLASGTHKSTNVEHTIYMPQISGQSYCGRICVTIA